jgi:hypothetical protein
MMQNSVVHLQSLAGLYNCLNWNAQTRGVLGARPVLIFGSRKMYGLDDPVPTIPGTKAMLHGYV